MTTQKLHKLVKFINDSLKAKPFSESHCNDNLTLLENCLTRTAIIMNSYKDGFYMLHPVNLTQHLSKLKDTSSTTYYTLREIKRMVLAEVVIQSGECNKLNDCGECSTCIGKLASLAAFERRFNNLITT